MCLGSCGGYSVAVLLASTLLFSWRAPKKKWMHDVGHERVPPMTVTGSHQFIVKYFQLWGCKDGYVMCLRGPVEDTVWQLCWLSTLLCSWRSPRKKWRHDAGHESVPPMTVTGSHWFIVRYFQLWGCKELGRICDVPGVLWRIQCGSFAGFHIAMFLEGPKKEVDAWCRSWKGTPYDCYRVPPVRSTVFPVVGVQGQTCDVPGGPVEDTVWQLCWLPHCYVSGGPPKKVEAWCRSWKGNPYDCYRVPPIHSTVFPVVGMQGRICDVPGVLWRKQCGSFAGFHIAMFLEAPNKKWRHDVGHERVPPMIVTGSHRFIIRYCKLWGCKDGYVMCLGSCGWHSVAALLASTLLCSWRAPKKKWMHDVGHERVPPMTVTGSHRFIVQYFQLWGCKDGYVMCLGGPVEDTVWPLCWLSTLLCSWRSPRKKWRHDVGHERVPPMTVTGSHWFIVRYLQLWGCKDGYMMCLGVLWRTQCGSSAGFPHCYVPGGPQERSGGTMSVMKEYPLWRLQGPTGS